MEKYIYLHIHLYIYIYSAGEGNGNPLQYSCLENSMNRGAWRSIVCGVAKSDTTERLTLAYIYVLSRFSCV